MSASSYKSMNSRFDVNRRGFLVTTSVVGAGLLVASPVAWADDEDSDDAYKSGEPKKPKTNIDDVKDIPRTEHSLPGRQPGHTVEVHSPKAVADKKVDAAAVTAMFSAGIEKLMGVSSEEAYQQLFTPGDVIGIKVNPVGAGLISTHTEVVDAIVEWLKENGHAPERIVIWDRFDYMLEPAGFTAERYPGVQIEGLQTMDEAAAMGQTDDDSGWLLPGGKHVSATNFDDNVYYYADIEAPQDKQYLNQHVFNGERSNFGNLVTRKLTKIINVPVFKNTGNGISMATKNIGYGAICNTGRLHRPLFFDVCTEVLAFPCVRDRLVLNVTDGLVGQYDGGPMANAAFTFDHNRLYFGTDPFALDMECQQQMVAIRKANGIEVNEHPMFTEYLHYAERLGIGVVDDAKRTHGNVEVG